MPIPTPRLVARCSKSLKHRVLLAEKSTGQNESEMVRVAVAEFFQRNKTPEQIIAAVIQHRSTAAK